MSRMRTLQEADFLKYFRQMDKRTIRKILSQYRSTGPIGYATSLILARILKVKERISSDRKLSEKLAKIQIYREAIGIRRNKIPAHNTFSTQRSRLGPEGFIQIHQHFILQAYETGLLTPPILDLPEIVKGNWIFTEDSIAFGKPHHKHKYPVGHRAHTLIAVSGIPVVSLIAPANESDQAHILPLLKTLRARYPDVPFVCVILDAGYDAEDLHRDIYTELEITPIIIRKPSMKWGPKLGETGTPLCLFGYPTRRKGIEYNHGRTKFAC